MRPILVWDMPTRLFHWLFAASIAIAWVTEGDDETLRVHAAAGYTAALLVLWRLGWGLVGSRHARFSAFLAGPARVLDFARSLLRGQPRHHAGHNPLGGLAVVAFLLLGLATPLLGHLLILDEAPSLALAGSGAHAAPLPGGDWQQPDEDDEESDEEGEGAHAGGFAFGREGAGRGEGGDDSPWEDAHEAAANAMLLLIALHLLGVALESVLQGQNLPRAMVTGRKRGEPGEAIRSAHVPMGGLLLLLVASLQAYYWLF